MTPRQRRMGWVLLAILVIGGFWLILDGVTDRLDDAEARSSANAAAAIDNRQALTEANGRVDQLGQQLRDLGEDPVVPTSPVAGASGLPGPQGERGLQGLMGLNGRDSTVPGPTGAVGATGSPGTSGQDGAPGPSGPAGATGPQGPSGTPGERGPSGNDGRGIASLNCGSDGRWSVTYTDGTTEDAGACRLLAAPEGDS